MLPRDQIDLSNMIRLDHPTDAAKYILEDEILMMYGTTIIRNGFPFISTQGMSN